MPRAFDDKELLERIDNDWDFLRETVQMLGDDAPAQIAEIRQSIQRADAAAVGRVAHALKGMISNFCAPAAQASAFEVEKIGKSGDLSTAPDAVAGLERELGALMSELNTLLATRAA
jgi:HPt (histidine-containing phosphotransfer) domain-containing protein